MGNLKAGIFMMILSQLRARKLVIGLTLILLSACSKQYDIAADAGVKIIHKKQYTTQVTEFELANQPKIRYVVIATAANNKQVRVLMTSTFAEKETGYAIAVFCASARVYSQGKEYAPVVALTGLNRQNCHQAGWIASAGNNFPDAKGADLDIVFSLDEALGDDFRLKLPSLKEVDNMQPTPVAADFAKSKQTTLTLHAEWFRENLFSGIR